MSKKRDTSGCDVNMTPMIDVVFQLIIFFIVTINISEMKDETVRLELGQHGVEADSGSNDSTTSLTVDVNKKGEIKVANQIVDEASFRAMIRRRMQMQGNTFQVWIRGDARAKHSDVRHVMDACAEEGLANVVFLAIAGEKGDPASGARTPDQRAFLGLPKKSGKGQVPQPLSHRAYSQYRR